MQKSVASHSKKFQSNLGRVLGKSACEPALTWCVLYSAPLFEILVEISWAK